MPWSRARARVGLCRSAPACPAAAVGMAPALPRFAGPEQGDITWYAAQDAAYRMARFVRQGVTKESPAAGVPWRV